MKLTDMPGEGGRLLIDGGASDPLPVDVAMREGADIMIAMGFEESPQSEIGNLIEQGAAAAGAQMPCLRRLLGLPGRSLGLAG